LVSRGFLATTAAAAALCAALVVPPSALPGLALTPPQVGVVAAFAAIALAALGALRLKGRWLERAMFLLLGAAVAAVGAAAVLLGTGLASPTLGFYGVFVCVLCAVSSRRSGLAMAAVSAAALAAVAAASPPLPALWVCLAQQLLTVGVGLAGG